MNAIDLMRALEEAQRGHKVTVTVYLRDGTYTELEVERVDLVEPSGDYRIIVRDPGRKRFDGPILITARTDHTNVRYVISLGGKRGGEDCNVLLERNERGTFDTYGEAKFVAKGIEERLRRQKYDVINDA